MSSCFNRIFGKIYIQGWNIAKKNNKLRIEICLLPSKKKKTEKMCMALDMDSHLTENIYGCFQKEFNFEC